MKSEREQNVAKDNTEEIQMSSNGEHLAKWRASLNEQQREELRQKIKEGILRSRGKIVKEDDRAFVPKAVVRLQEKGHRLTITIQERDGNTYIKGSSRSIVLLDCPQNVEQMLAFLKKKLVSLSKKTGHKQMETKSAEVIRWQ